jgi:hypothetical protein
MTSKLTFWKRQKPDIPPKEFKKARALCRLADRDGGIGVRAYYNGLVALEQHGKLQDRTKSPYKWFVPLQNKVQDLASVGLKISDLTEEIVNQAERLDRLWEKDLRKRIGRLNGDPEEGEFNSSDNKSRKKKMKQLPDLVIQRSEAVKFLQRLGFKQAHKYEPHKLLRILGKLPDQIWDEIGKFSDVDLGPYKTLATALCDALDKNVRVLIREDLKGSVSMPRGKAREVDDEVEDQDEEETDEVEEEEEEEVEEVEDSEEEESEDEPEEVEDSDEEEVEEEEEIPRKKGKGKKTHAKGNGKVVKKPAKKRASGPSNKEVIYKAWKKSKFKADIDTLSKVDTPDEIQISTLRSWTGTWRHGEGIPKAFNTEEEAKMLRKHFGTKSFPGKSEKAVAKKVVKKGKKVKVAEEDDE